MDASGAGFDTSNGEENDGAAVGVELGLIALEDDDMSCLLAWRTAETTLEVG